MTVTIRVRSILWFATGVVLTLVCTLLVVQARQVNAELPGDDDATFVPVEPCRLFDYRSPPDQVGERSTPLGPGEVHVQQVTGNVGNCVGGLAIPGDAVAIAMNVTAVAPTAQTNIRIYPADVEGVPLVSNLNVVAGQAPFPNKVDVKLSLGGAIRIFNQAGSVSLVGDAVGYYTSSTLQRTISDIETSSRSQVSFNGWTKITEQYGINSRQEGIAIATFEIFESTDNDRVQCGFGRATGSQPDLGSNWTWESPDQGDYTAQTLHVNFKAISSIALFCRVIENGNATVTGVEMTVLATGSQ